MDNLEKLYNRRDKLHFRRRMAVKLGERILDKKDKDVIYSMRHADTLMIDNELIIVNQWIMEATREGAI